MILENGSIERAKHLVQKIKIKASQAISPIQLKSILLLKGLNEIQLCQRALISPKILRGWMKGDIPILPSKVSDLIGLIVGFEKGQFTSDRTHFFNFQEKNISRNKIKDHLLNFSSAFRGAVKSSVFSEQSNDAWFGGSKISVIGFFGGAHLVVSQVGKSRFGSSSNFSCLDDIGWAAHASSSDGTSSELVVGESLRYRLASSALVENDLSCNLLVQSFCQAKEEKEKHIFANSKRPKRYTF